MGIEKLVYGTVVAAAALVMAACNGSSAPAPSSTPAPVTRPALTATATPFSTATPTIVPTPHNTPTPFPTVTPTPTPTIVPYTPTPIPTRTPTPTPVPTYTPTPTQIPKQTPEWVSSLATIKQYVPELAGVISQQGWFKDGVTQEENERLRIFRALAPIFADNLAKLKKDQPCLYDFLVEEQPLFSDGSLESISAKLSDTLITLQTLPPYLQSGLSCKTQKTQIAGTQNRIALLYDRNVEPSTFYKDIKTGESHRVEAMDWIVKSLEDHSAFFGMKRSFWSTLIVSVDYKYRDPGGGALSIGSLGFAFVGSTYDNIFQPEIMSHELAHTAVIADHSWPMWYGEGLATILQYNAIREIRPNALEEEYTAFKRLHATNLTPLEDYDYGRKGAGEAYGRGMVFLLDYRNLAGHTAFQSTVIEAASFREQSGNGFIGASAKLEEIFIKNAPELLRGQVKAMYDSVVFGK